MLRDFILGQKVKKNIKRRKDLLTTRYDASKRIGIIFNMKEFSYERIKTLRNVFEVDGKEIHIIGYTDKLGDPVIHDSVVKREVSFSGFIKSLEFEKFNTDTYDFLVVLSYDSDITLKYLVSQCKASCKVGLYTENNTSPVADLQIKAHKGSETGEIAKYLKMIK